MNIILFQMQKLRPSAAMLVMELAGWSRPNCLAVCHSCVCNTIGRELSLVLRAFFDFFESSLSQNVHSDISI